MQHDSSDPLADVFGPLESARVVSQLCPRCGRPLGHRHDRASVTVAWESDHGTRETNSLLCGACAAELRAWLGVVRPR